MIGDFNTDRKLSDLRMDVGRQRERLLGSIDSLNKFEQDARERILFNSYQAPLTPKPSPIEPYHKTLNPIGKKGPFDEFPLKPMLSKPYERPLLAKPDPTFEPHHKIFNPLGRPGPLDNPRGPTFGGLR